MRVPRLLFRLLPDGINVRIEHEQYRTQSRKTRHRVERPSGMLVKYIRPRHTRGFPDLLLFPESSRLSRAHAVYRHCPIEEFVLISRAITRALLASSRMRRVHN